MPPSTRSAVPISFSAEAEVARVGHVLGGDVLDALVGHLVEVTGRGEREPGDDRHLGRGVPAGHVVGGVGLGVPELLRACERGRVGRPAAGHLGEDEVRGAVDDAVDALHVRGRERLLQHADDRHDAGHGALEAQLDLVLAGGRPQLLAVAGQQQLVGARRRACRRASPCRTYSRAGSMPPISSTIRSRVGEDLVEVAARAREHAADLGPFGPVTCAICSARSLSSCSNAAPTVPCPSSPTLYVSGHAGPRRSRGARPGARSPSLQNTTGGRGTPL